jgi:tryptophanyl-tRNA synthetase
VPVGDDQRQHIELMRDIAQRFNERFGETLVVPRHVIPEVGGRIMDLQAPENKMSTTAASELGTIYLLDDDDAIARKFKKAVADSGHEVERAPDKPGISNLIEILAVIRGADPAEIEREFEGSGYGDFKKAVAEAVAGYLAPVRARYEELRSDEDELERILAAGADKARAIAAPTLVEVRAAMGVGTPT